MLHQGLVGSSVGKQATKLVIGTPADKTCFPPLLAPSMNPQSTRQNFSDITLGEKHGTRTWITILDPSGAHSARTFSPCSANDFCVRAKWASTTGGWTIDRRLSTGYTRGIQDQLTRTRQTERLFAVKVQNRSFLGPGEIDKTSSGVASGIVGAVDSCLAAKTGKYISLTAVQPRTQRNDRNQATTPIKDVSRRDTRPGNRDSCGYSTHH